MLSLCLHPEAFSCADDVQQQQGDAAAVCRTWRSAVAARDKPCDVDNERNVQLLSAHTTICVQQREFATEWIPAES